MTTPAWRPVAGHLKKAEARERARDFKTWAYGDHELGELQDQNLTEEVSGLFSKGPEFDKIRPWKGPGKPKTCFSKVQPQNAFYPNPGHGNATKFVSMWDEDWKSRHPKKPPVRLRARWRRGRSRCRRCRRRSHLRAHRGQPAARSASHGGRGRACLCPSRSRLCSKRGWRTEPSRTSAQASHRGCSTSGGRWRRRRRRGPRIAGQSRSSWSGSFARSFPRRQRYRGGPGRVLAPAAAATGGGSARAALDGL